METTIIIRNVEAKYIRKIMHLLKSYEFNSVEFSLSAEKRGYECLEIAVNEFGNYFEIGAGTVTRKDQIDRLVEIGVDFIFTPAYSEELVKYSAEKDLRIIPGVFSPSEIQNGIAYGLKLFKLFPASEFSYGFLKAINGPFPNVRLMAVGGVSNYNLKEYYSHGYSGVALGSSVIMQDATDKDLDLIESNLIELRKVLGEMNEE